MVKETIWCSSFGEKIRAVKGKIYISIIESIVYKRVREYISMFMGSVHYVRMVYILSTDLSTVYPQGVDNFIV